MADDEELPAFLRYGAFTVGVYVVVVTILVRAPSAPVEGPTLVAFSLGFVVFVTVYFGSMWAGWLFFGP